MNAKNRFDYYLLVIALGCFFAIALASTGWVYTFQFDFPVVQNAYLNSSLILDSCFQEFGMNCSNMRRARQQNKKTAYS